MELAVPVLLDVEARDVERRHGDRELLRRKPREVKGQRVGHRRHQIGARDDDRDAEEMRRVQRDLAADLLALEQLFEQLVAAPLGMHDCMLDLQKRLQGQALGISRVI